MSEKKGEFRVGDRVHSDRNGFGTVVGILQGLGGDAWRRVKVCWDSMFTIEFVDEVEHAEEAAEG